MTELENITRSVIAEEIGKQVGVTKEQILTSPQFERTRENMKEFGGVVKSATLLINEISQEFGYKVGMKERNMLVRAMSIVKNKDFSNPRGLRIVKGDVIQAIEGYEFNPKCSTYSTFVANRNCLLGTSMGTFGNSNNTENLGRVITARWEFGSFDQYDIKWPENATDMKMTGILVKIKEENLNSISLKYSTNRIQIWKQEITITRLMTTDEIRNTITDNISIVCDDDAKLESGDIVLGLFSITFGQTVNRVYYPLKDKRANSIGVDAANWCV